MDEFTTPEEIEQRTRKLCLTMAELCEVAGIAPNTFSRWKQGHCSPNIATVRRLIMALREIEDQQA